MNSPKFAFLGLVCFYALFGSVRGFPRSAGATTNPIPSNGPFLGPTGILFPSVSSAGGVNAAALPLMGKLTALQAAYSPSKGSEAQNFFGSLTATSKNMGVGVGYFGSKYTSGMVNGGFAGAGFKLEPISVGLTVRGANLSNQNGNSVDFGLIAGEGKGLTFGFVMYNLNHAAQLDAGVGFGAGKKYNMEVNILFPPFSQLSGNGYILTIAGTIYAADVVGLSFKTSYYALGSTYQHMLGTTVWLSDVTSLFVQFTTPRTWTAGMTLIF